jgi:hypothetical protein
MQYFYGFAAKNSQSSPRNFRFLWLEGNDNDALFGSNNAVLAHDITANYRDCQDSSTRDLAQLSFYQTLDLLTLLVLFASLHLFNSTAA